MSDFYGATAHVLYRIFDRSNTLLYVGITLNPAARMRDHRDAKDWWHEVANITLATFDSRIDLEVAEREAIATEHPKYNVVHNNRPGRKVAVSEIRIPTYSLAEVVEAGFAPSERWLMKRLRSGDIKGRKVGRHWRLTEADLDALIEWLGNETKLTVTQLVVAPPMAMGGVTALSQARRRSS